MLFAQGGNQHAQRALQHILHDRQHHLGHDPDPKGNHQEGSSLNAERDPQRKFGVGEGR